MNIIIWYAELMERKGNIWPFDVFIIRLIICLFILASIVCIGITATVRSDSIDTMIPFFNLFLVFYYVFNKSIFQKRYLTVYSAPVSKKFILECC